jgi:hypothetical protein
MPDSLGMSTASIISNKDQEQSNIDSPPSTPPKDAEKPLIPPPQQLHTLPVDIHEPDHSKPPPTWHFIQGHARYFLKTAIQFIFKDNNLPLLINIIYHLVAARALVGRPWKTVSRYLSIPPTPTAHSALKHQIEQTTSIAIDAFRTQGVQHVALAILSALALKERRQSSERSALLVLTLASVGQTWAHTSAYWKSSTQQYTLKALQEVGASDLLVTLISSIALSKTVRRTGRLV